MDTTLVNPCHRRNRQHSKSNARSIGRWLDRARGPATTVGGIRVPRQRRHTRINWAKQLSWPRKSSI